METKVQNHRVMAVEYIIQTMGKLWLRERNGLLGMVAEGSGIWGRIRVRKTHLRRSNVEDEEVVQEEKHEHIFKRD